MTSNTRIIKKDELARKAGCEISSLLTEDINKILITACRAEAPQVDLIPKLPVINYSTGEAVVRVLRRAGYDVDHVYEAPYANHGLGVHKIIVSI